MENTGIARPHGGKLVSRITKKDPSGLLSISINTDLANDVENIADGIFSPLEGFLTQGDFEKVISRGRLANDLPWTVPIVLDVDKETATKMKDARDVALNVDGKNFAILHIEDVYNFDKNSVTNGVYGTSDPKHPGVAKTMSMKEFLVGLLVLILIAVFSVLGVLLYPLMLVLGIFLRLILLLVLLIIAIWIVGKVTLLLIEVLTKK